VQAALEAKFGKDGVTRGNKAFDVHPTGYRVDADVVTAFAYVVANLSALLFCWNLWLWSCPVIRQLSRRPKLKGTWKGLIQTDYPDSQTGKKAEPIDVYVVIRQTFCTLDARLFSRESNSVSLCATLLSDTENIYRIAVTYLNTPTTLNVDKSPISHGGKVVIDLTCDTSP
jgi:hypothetical protein